MKTYHKIQTVFLRDPDTKFKKLLNGVFSKDEFSFLAEAQWTFTEKVDGTNVRIILDDKLHFEGKTDSAQMPMPLVRRLQELVTESQLREIFPNGNVCLYGEGYGAKIQKGGGNYKSTQDFVLFDVKIGDLWLSRKSVEDIALKLGLDVVPIVGEGTLHDMVNLCRDGMTSKWGDFQSEGLIAKPLVELKSRNGDRIITKLKTKDF